MKRTTLIAVGALGATFIVMFFVFAPVAPMNIIPCFPDGNGNGYASISYHLFYVGEIYRGGQFSWSTFNDQNCY